MSPPPTPSGSLFMIGTGPLIGSHTAQLFATHTFTHIALFARSSSTLAASKSFIHSAAPSTTITTHSVDVTDHAALCTGLEEAITEIGAPEVVVYNAALVRGSKFGDYSTEKILEDFKVPNLGLYTTATVLLPYLRKLGQANPKAHPALFVTSGAIIHEPFAPVFSLSMAKTAQASLVKSIRDANKGVVHVALVTVGGPVGEGEGNIRPGDVAERFWELYGQERERWEFEVRVGW